MKRATASSIEPLEPRIAPAALNLAGTILTYTDIDGDLVKVTFTKAIMDVNDFTFSTGGVDGDITTPQKLVTIDLTGKNGASLTSTATPQKFGNLLEGDSHANVKTINAANTNLVSVKVDGDVQAINAVEVKSFSALSFGAGYDDNSLNPSQLSTVGTFAVKGDVAGHVALTVTGDVKSFTVGGSIGTLDNYRIQINGNVGAVKVGGSIIGQATNRSLVISGEVGSFSVGGSIVGGDGEISDGGSQIELGKAKSITVLGDLHGKAGAGGGTIQVFGGDKMGAVKIGGSIIGGTGARAGVLDLNVSPASITISGNLEGNSGSKSGSVTTRNVGLVKIGGSIIGDAAGYRSGRFDAVGTVGSFTLGHDLISRGENGQIFLNGVGPVASLKIGGDIRCEDSNAAINTAVISVSGILGSLSVGGSIIGEENHFARILIGGIGAADGTAALKSMTVKHSVIRASIAPGWDGTIGLNSPRNPQAGIGSITIGGDMSGTFITSGGTAGVDGVIGTFDDGLVAGGKAGIASLKVVGAITGLAGDSTEYNVYSRNIQKVTIGKATYSKALLVGHPLFLDAIGKAVINCPS